jgi:hypothetical protein
MTLSAFSASIGTDRGEAIVGAMVTHLPQSSILLPSAAVLEKIAFVERARARKQAYKELTAHNPPPCDPVAPITAMIFEVAMFVILSARATRQTQKADARSEQSQLAESPSWGVSSRPRKRTDF